MAKLYEVKFIRTFVTEVEAESEDEAISLTEELPVDEYEDHLDGEPWAVEIGDAE